MDIGQMIKNAAPSNQRYKWNYQWDRIFDMIGDYPQMILYCIDVQIEKLKQLQQQHPKLNDFIELRQKFIAERMSNEQRQRLDEGTLFDQIKKFENSQGRLHY